MEQVIKEFFSRRDVKKITDRVQVFEGDAKVGASFDFYIEAETDEEAYKAVDLLNGLVDYSKDAYPSFFVGAKHI